MEIKTDTIDSNNLPKSILRKGWLIVVVNLILLISLFFGLKTNETLKGQIVIENANKNLDVFARKEGVFKAFKREGDSIQQSELVGVYENYTSHENIATLKNWLTNLNLNEESLGSDKTIVSSQGLNKLNIGEIRPQFAAFTHECSQYFYLNYVEKNYLKKANDFDYAQLNNIYREIQNIGVSDSLLFEQSQLNYKKRDRDSFLLKENVISQSDFEQTNKLKLDAELVKIKNRMAVYTSENAGLKLNKTIEEVNQSLKDRKNIVLKQIKMSFDILQSEIEKWEYYNVVRSPINGKCAFKSTDNQFFVALSQHFLTIYPLDTVSYIGHLQLPADRIGKAKIGHNVRITLKEYPFYEYGSVDGIIKYISKVPFNNNYNITVELPNGLITSYNKKIEDINSLNGTGEIIVSKSNILNHVINFFRWQKQKYQ